MKKLLTTAILAFAGIVNAASVNWGTGAVAVTFGGETLSSGVTGYLVSLGTTDDPTQVWVLNTTEGTLSGATAKSDATPVTFPPVCTPWLTDYKEQTYVFSSEQCIFCG
jgi:hypothetical protein